MLKISAKGEYGLILIKYLIKQKTYKKIQEVSTETGLKEPILRKIVNKLEKSGIIKSIKGRSGGIILLKENISVYDLLEAVGGDDLKVATCSSKVCKNSSSCEISGTISSLQKGLESVLKITKI